MKQYLIILLIIFITCSSCTSYKKIDTSYASININSLNEDLKESILQFENNIDSLYMPKFLK